MKKVLLLLALSFMFSFGICQSHLRLEASKHIYQAGDSLYKYQVEYKDPGSKGRALRWDFSHLKIVNDSYLIKYFLPDKTDTARLCGVEHRTRYYYRQQQDSLWALGFENYTTLMNYTRPELKLKFPFAYGDTLYSVFEGEGIYSNLLPLEVKGWTRVAADAEGELTLPDNQKIHQALRVHTRRFYSETGKESVQMTLDTYTWYARGLRYPVFESIQTTLHKRGEAASSDTTAFNTSFYYSPEQWTEKEKETVTSGSGVDENGNPLPEAERVFTEARMLPNPVINNLAINYKLTRRAQIWFSIHNNVGQPMCQTTPQLLNQGNHQTTVLMGHLTVGTYTVYVHVDDMVIQRVVVKK